jgi:hypothetical protein
MFGSRRRLHKSAERPIDGREKTFHDRCEARWDPPHPDGMRASSMRVAQENETII